MIAKIRPGQRQGGKGGGEGRRPIEREEVREDREGRWQRMKLYTQNDPAALYRADKAASQQMRLYEADPDVVAYQETVKAGDNVVCARIDDTEGQQHQLELAPWLPLLVRRGLRRRTGQESGSEGTKGGV